MTTYTYLGHEIVGAYVAKQLEGISWIAVDDVRDADVVFTYFTHASALEDAYFEDEGIVKNARKETAFVDLSPSTLSVSREIFAVDKFMQEPVRCVQAYAEEKIRLLGAEGKAYD